MQSSVQFLACSLLPTMNFFALKTSRQNVELPNAQCFYTIVLGSGVLIISENSKIIPDWG